MRSGKTVIALHFLHPARMVVRRLADGSYEYRCRDYTAGAERVIAEANLMHIVASDVDKALA